MPTECGKVFRKKMSSAQDSEIVNLLKNAGAIIMGKTATAELAYIHPCKTKNPHDYSRTPGGSSSGSAAVVASHMAHLSIGSQTGGSIIRPASYCGVVGYKPSYGLISRNGVLKVSDKLDTMGVFGKTVKDVALLAKILIKKDLYDASTIHFSADKMLEVCEGGEIQPAMKTGLIEAAEFNNPTSDSQFGMQDVSKHYHLGSFHQSQEMFEIPMNKKK